MIIEARIPLVSVVRWGGERAWQPRPMAPPTWRAVLTGLE
jgi:hypothetical protein